MFQGQAKCFEAARARKSYSQVSYIASPAIPRESNKQQSRTLNYLLTACSARFSTSRLATRKWESQKTPSYPVAHPDRQSVSLRSAPQRPRIFAGLLFCRSTPPPGFRCSSGCLVPWADGYLRLVSLRPTAHLCPGSGLAIANFIEMMPVHLSLTQGDPSAFLPPRAFGRSKYVCDSRFRGRSLHPDRFVLRNPTGRCERWMWPATK